VGPLPSSRSSATTSPSNPRRTTRGFPFRRAPSRCNPPTPIDEFDTCFDDTHAVADAGLLLAATLAERLSIEQAADALIELGERAGAHRPGRKLLGLVHTMLAGGDCIDDAHLLRCGQTATVLGHRVRQPLVPAGSGPVR
jgi:hypothetical protein